MSWDNNKSLLVNMTTDQSRALVKWCEAGINIKIPVNEVKEDIPREYHRAIPDRINFEMSLTNYTIVFKVKTELRQYRFTDVIEEDWWNYLMKPVLMWVWVNIDDKGYTLSM